MLIFWYVFREDLENFLIKIGVSYSHPSKTEKTELLQDIILKSLDFYSALLQYMENISNFCVNSFRILKTNELHFE